MIRRIDELYLEHPELGARRMSRWLQREGHPASRRLVSRLMKHMGLCQRSVKVYHLRSN